MSHEILPPVVLALDAQWPAASGSRPAGVAEVGSWSVEREIVSSALPGNLRARSGLSVGSGSASVAQRDTMLAPWAPGAAERVTAGTTAALYAEAAGGREPLGAWVTGEISGALSSAQVSVPLLEAQGPGKRGVHATASGGDVEPAALVADLARQCGFQSVPAPVASCLWALPVSYGIDVTEKLPPAAVLEDSGFAWGSGSGALGAKGFGVSVEAASWRDVTVTLNVNAGNTGTVSMWFSDSSGSLIYVTINPALRWLLVTPRGGSQVSTTWTGGSITGAQRLQVGIRLSGAPGAWTAVEARARSGQASAWSSWVGGTPTGNAEGNAFFSLNSVGIEVSGIQVTTNADDPALYAAPTADIQPIGFGSRRSRWLPGDVSPWSLIQELCAANLAATWVTRRGVLTTRNRDHLAGSGIAAKAIDVARQVEDIAWSIDPADSADRLEVSFTPGGSSAGSTTLHAVEEKLSIPARGHIDLSIPLASPAEYQPEWDHASWVPSGSDIESWPRGIFSCFTAPTGGAALDASLTSFVQLPSSSGSIRLRIYNRSSSTAWLVDANGAACCIVKGKNVRSFSTVQTIARGALAADALNPATVDLSHWVQDPVLAESITDFLWGRLTGQSWKAASVRVALDWSIDIGQIVSLSHPDSALSVRAMVTKVALNGQPGEVAQNLDLVLLPPTWTEFDAAWSGKTWADFDALWAGKTWPDFDYKPLSS